MPIHSKNKQYKERKGHLVELNWGCRVQESIPADIRPRGGSVRRKATVADGTLLPELPWQDWSLDLLTQLEKLSSATQGKMAFAQELMILEVRQRQDDVMNRLKSSAEILRSDLERINKDLRQQNSVGPVEDDDISSEDEGGDENEQDDQEAEENDHQAEDDGQDERMEVDQGEIVEDGGGGETNDIREETSAETNNLIDVKREDASDDADTVNGAAHRARETGSKLPTRAMVTKSRASLQKHAKILRLRADAMRLKQEAAKRMAEAYELEAKMFSAEAKQFNE